GSSIASGSVFPTGTLALGTYSFFAEATTCTNSIARVPITVTVHPLPTVSISTSNTLLCLGSSCSLLAGGALTYSWNTGALSNSISITPTLTTTFTVIGTDVNSCSSSAVFTQSVTVCTYLQSETAYSSIQIFPSPFSERCNVSGLVQGQVLTLYNSIGQVVKKACSGGNTMSFFTGELSSGLYILNIQGDSSSLSFRLLKE
ncbi:MAG TPA: T9SS type A sorting domain-containing protein, partial [Bacteroidia bacterium]|nr:T9SS type A sorting domain-containing protein [Bacteroidia bacterium]